MTNFENPQSPAERIRQFAADFRLAEIGLKKAGMSEVQNGAADAFGEVTEVISKLAASHPQGA